MRGVVASCGSWRNAMSGEAAGSGGSGWLVSRTMQAAAARARRASSAVLPPPAADQGMSWLLGPVNASGTWFLSEVLNQDRYVDAFSGPPDDGPQIRSRLEVLVPPFALCLHDEQAAVLVARAAAVQHHRACTLYQLAKAHHAPRGRPRPGDHGPQSVTRAFWWAARDAVVQAVYDKRESNGLGGWMRCLELNNLKQQYGSIFMQVRWRGVRHVCGAARARAPRTKRAKEYRALRAPSVARSPPALSTSHHCHVGAAQ